MHNLEVCMFLVRKGSRIFKDRVCVFELEVLLESVSRQNARPAMRSDSRGGGEMMYLSIT